MADTITRCRPLLGTFVEVTADCVQAIDAAFDVIARVHSLMSAHDSASDVSRINRKAHCEAVAVDPWTALVLERAIHWAKASGGIFDVVAAGKLALERGLIPMHEGQPVPEAGHWTWLELNGSMVRLFKPGCVDLGGIAKGFAADRAILALKCAGASFGLVNAGGDLAGFGPRPWPIQVLDPFSRRAIANLSLCNGALATSAILPGGSADHLPKSRVELISATVCAPAAIDADALTKIVLADSVAAIPCLKSVSARAFVRSANGAIRPIEPERLAA